VDIVIRELTGQDLTERFLETLASLSEVNLSVTEAAEVFQRRLRAGIRTFVALHHDEIVGTASLLIEQKFIHHGGKSGHIEDVAVHHDHQRQGIGSLLVAHATEEARKAGCYKVMLNCFDDRIPFYAKLGYRAHDRGMRLDFSGTAGS
jgi:glucosamine-phosphate N-acetyltransferase